jgi:hypothetical protein
LLESRCGQSFRSQLYGSGIKECDLVAHFTEGGVERSALYRPSSWKPWLLDDERTWWRSQMNNAMSSGPVTFTAVPPGSGVRVALDRDGDGIANRNDSTPAGQ